MSWLFLHKLYKVMLKSTINTLPSSRIDINRVRIKSMNNSNNTLNIEEIDNETDKPSMLSIVDDIHDNNEENENKNENDNELETKHDDINIEDEHNMIQIEDDNMIIMMKSRSRSPSQITEEKDTRSKPPSPSQQDEIDDNKSDIDHNKRGDAIMSITQNIDRENLQRLTSRDYLKEYDLITLMTKYSLLVTISYSSSLLSVIIIFILLKDVELMIYSNAKYIEHLIISISILINMLCLYLSYAFNNNHYNFFCKFGHKLFNNCCIKCISDKMRNDTQQLLQ